MVTFTKSLISSPSRHSSLSTAGNRRKVAADSILYTKLKTPKGRTDKISIDILSDIEHWHQPKKNGGSKFYGDIWHTSYKYFQEKFGYSQEAIRKVLVKYEELGLARREFRITRRRGKVYSNELFIHFNRDKFNDLINYYPPANHIVDAPSETPPCPIILDTYISNTKTYIKNIDLERSIFKNDIQEDIVEPSIEKTSETNSSHTEISQVFPIAEQTKPKTKNKGDLERVPMAKYHEQLTEEDVVHLREGIGRPLTLADIEEWTKKMGEKYPNYGFYKKEHFFKYAIPSLRAENAKWDAKPSNYVVKKDPIHMLPAIPLAASKSLLWRKVREGLKIYYYYGESLDISLFSKCDIEQNRDSQKINIKCPGKAIVNEMIGSYMRQVEEVLLHSKELVSELHPNVDISRPVWNWFEFSVNENIEIGR